MGFSPINTIQTVFFLFFTREGGGGGGGRAVGRSTNGNAMNIKGMMIELGGYIACLEMSPLTPHHEMMMSQDAEIVS